MGGFFGVIGLGGVVSFLFVFLTGDGRVFAIRLATNAALI